MKKINTLSFGPLVTAGQVAFVFYSLIWPHGKAFHSSGAVDTPRRVGRILAADFPSDVRCRRASGIPGPVVAPEGRAHRPPPWWTPPTGTHRQARGHRPTFQTVSTPACKSITLESDGTHGTLITPLIPSLRCPKCPYYGGFFSIGLNQNLNLNSGQNFDRFGEAVSLSKSI